MSKAIRQPKAKQLLYPMLPLSSWPPIVVSCCFPTRRGHVDQPLLPMVRPSRKLKHIQAPGGGVPIPSNRAIKHVHSQWAEIRNSMVSSCHFARVYPLAIYDTFRNKSDHKPFLTVSMVVNGVLQVTVVYPPIVSELCQWWGFSKGDQRHGC